MSKLKKKYDYIFYVFYRFWEIVPSRWWSEWKAGATMIFLCIIFISAISNFCKFNLKIASLSDYPIFTLSMGLVIGLMHHFMYIYNDKWKDKIIVFNGMDKRKDAFGILVVLLLIILIIFGYWYSNYLLRSVDWVNLP